MIEHTNINQVECDNCETTVVIDGFKDLRKIIDNPYCEVCGSKLLDDNEINTVNKILLLHKHAMLLSDEFTLERVYIGYDIEGKLNLMVSVEN